MPRIGDQSHGAAEDAIDSLNRHKSGVEDDSQSKGTVEPVRWLYVIVAMPVPVAMPVAMAMRVPMVRVVLVVDAHQESALTGLQRFGHIRLMLPRVRTY